MKSAIKGGERAGKTEIVRRREESFKITKAK